MSIAPSAPTIADARTARPAAKRPSGRRMPPLNALRSFEAAARHLSIVKAADELNVTPAAVSHQVKVLERFLGVTLLDRANRSLVLTAAGQACLPDIHDFFKGLADENADYSGAPDCMGYDTGTKAGPTRPKVNGAQGCTRSKHIGCRK